MKCEDAQDNFCEYWDMAEDSDIRREVDDHLLNCGSCAEQFRLWEESGQLIQSLSFEEEIIGPVDHINKGVMERIYSEQAWLRPVAHKSYQFTRSFRRNIAIVTACFMAMFSSALLYFLFHGSPSSSGASSEKVKQLTGLIETANASSDSMPITAHFISEVPMASVSDPFVLKVVPAYPQYWVALSILGIIMTLLVLNWISRTRN
ncbi:anti-sigma factor family protein [Paenibacillus protaetiae]|uniref:Zf-HC2 domain-containing protein n=1 Tax=Paenibacillus protaetiae TaxID=2509456 RepID=A0A4P6EWN6_9BACL|nr:hypothetical protein [Paenibacillus protaetiae]QAY66149.1 hypothetical protein ET464_06810 [Paenibacillus protaetiae]